MNMVLENGDFRSEFPNICLYTQTWTKPLFTRCHDYRSSWI